MIVNKIIHSYFEFNFTISINYEENNDSADLKQK